MRVKKPTPFDEAFARHTAEQIELQRQQDRKRFVKAIINLQLQVKAESGLRDLGSQNFLRTGTFND